MKMVNGGALHFIAGLGTSITWKAENGHLIMSDVRGEAVVFDYKVSGSTLTLTDDNGESVTFITEQKVAELRASKEKEAERAKIEIERAGVGIVPLSDLIDTTRGFYMLEKVLLDFVQIKRNVFNEMN